MFRVLLGFLLFSTVFFFVGCAESEQVLIPEVDYAQLPPDKLMLELAVRGDMRNMRDLVGRHPELVHVRGGYDRTPLHFAAANGQNEVVRYLLELGADPSALDEYSEDPATAAQQFGHTSTARILREAAQGGR